MSVARVRVRIVPVGHHNWRAVADLEVTEDQRRFVGATTGYLALTHLGEQGWAPLAILADGKTVGFAMWGHDKVDDACWIGGFLIDRAHQRRGHGRSAMQALIAMAQASGAGCVKLSYDAENLVARSLYASLGFRETGEREGEEIVASLDLEEHP
jgi:diamine N-acetyltransferase